MHLKEKGIAREQQEITKKEQRLEQLRGEQERLNKVIEYIFFHGEKVQKFDSCSILQQLAREQQPSFNFDDVE
jgi:hypothetical protein